MISGNALAETGALLGDPARANILLALMDGRALTAGELAWHAGVSAQTTSGHLAKLVEARLVDVVRVGVLVAHSSVPAAGNLICVAGLSTMTS